MIGHLRHCWWQTCRVFPILVSAVFILCEGALAEDRRILSSTMPVDFADIESERAVILDVYYDGSKVGEARATLSPGHVTFSDPSRVVAMLDNLADPAGIAAQLSGSVSSNANLACSENSSVACEELPNDRTIVVLDQDRFRLDVIVPAKDRRVRERTDGGYLSATSRAPALLSSWSGSLYRNQFERTSVHLQNRSIASLGTLRVRSDVSASDTFGVEYDNLTLEADRKNWRFLGGLLWAPGSEMLGRRQIIGIGATTQLDTLRSRDEILGTPLDLFLSQPSRVDLLVDGRLVSSQIQPGGLSSIDTTRLMTGSYEVILRIHEQGGQVREESRFFTKGTALAPMGRPMLSAFLGTIQTGRALRFDSSSLFYQAAAAVRLSHRLGIDTVVLGTNEKAIVEIGASHHSRLLQSRMVVLASTSRDMGVSLRANSVGSGPLSVSFDLRKIWSADGRSILPSAAPGRSFNENAIVGLADIGSYTQGHSFLSYHWRNATLRLGGLFRRSARAETDYRVNASIEVPVVARGRMNFVLLADAEKTNRGVATFLGFRLNASKRQLSTSLSGGIVTGKESNDRSPTLIGEAQVGWSDSSSERTISADAAIGRSLDGSRARATASYASQAFRGRADVVQALDGSRHTDAAITFATSFAVTSEGVGLSGRDASESGVKVSLSGAERGGSFEVLVDGVPRAIVTKRQHTVLSLPPYRSYEIRLRPLGSAMSSTDYDPRTVTLYPGNIVDLNWTAARVAVLFGRALELSGLPLSNREVRGSFGISRTDRDGFFQIETREGDTLVLGSGSGADCRISINGLSPAKDFISVGDLNCVK